MTTSNPGPGPRGDEASAAAATAAGTPAPAPVTATADPDEDRWWLALTDEDFARQDEIFEVEQEARAAGRLPEIIRDEDDPGLDFDPACAPPVSGGWVPGMPWPEEPAPVPELFPAGLLDRDTDPGRPDGPPFAKGTPLDTAAPGPVLAGKLDHTASTGFGDFCDDQLAGVMLAATRMQSRATAQLLAAASELARRRAADPDPRVGEATGTEIAVLLAVTRRAAERLLGFATDLDQLPATRAALWDGRIDSVKAELIGYETGLLTPALAGAVEQLVIEDAPRMTTTMLRARLRRAVIAADPAAARRRVEKARREARVELYDEQSGGTAALAGRDLPVAGALAADQRIDATARALKQTGVRATLAQLRAAVFLALLTGGNPHTFLPPTGSGDDAATAGPDTNAPAQPATSPARTRGADTQPATTAGDDSQPATGSDGEPAPPGGSSGPAATQPDTAHHPDETHAPGPANTPDGADAPDTAGGPQEGAGGWPGKLTLRGSVHLSTVTLPQTSLRPAVCPVWLVVGRLVERGAQCSNRPEVLLHGIDTFVNSPQRCQLVGIPPTPDVGQGFV